MLMRPLMTVLLACVLGAPAFGGPVLQLRPDPEKLHGPELLRVDILLSGLSTADPDVLLAGFNLTIAFDPAVLQLLPDNTLFGAELGDPNDPAQTIVGVDGSVEGSVGLFNLSLLEGSAATCVFCLGPYLEDLQGDAFTLATLFFQAIPAPELSGYTTLNVTDLVLADAFGQEIGGVLVLNATVPIDEPGSLPLAVAAVGTAWLLRRRRHAVAARNGQ